MSSTTPSIYTGKEILVAYYNKKKNLNLSVADVEFGTPERLDSPGTLSNTSVRLFHKLGVPYVGSPKLYYDRIHVSFLGTITIEKGNSVRLHQLLPAINKKYSINITEEDVEDEQLGSIGTGEILVNFKIKPTSVTYYDGDIIYTPNYPDPNTGIRPEIDVYGYWDEDTSSDNVVITNDALTAQMDNRAMALCKVPVTSGKAFWEVEINETGLMVGVAVPQASVDSTTNKVIGMDEYSWGLDTSTGKIWHKGVGLTYCPPIPVGSVVGIMLDVKGGILTFMVGNTIYNIAAIGFEQYDEVYPAISGNGTSQSKGTANFGQNPIRLTPPVDYARGVFTMKTVIPPTPGGGGGDYPPAGTVFALYCKGLDRWGVFANGEGGATDVLVQANSTACGAVPTITATISNTPTSVTIVKGNIVETVYTLSNPVEEVAEFDTLIEYIGNANNTYHDAPRVKIGNGAYTNIVDNRITLPAGDDRFTVRMTISAGILPLVGDGLHFKLKVNDDYAALITTTGYLDFKINVQNSSIPPEGMLLHTYCNGFDKIGVYADGLGGSYERTIETNSEECGYVPFVTRQVVLQGEGTVTFPFETSEVKVTATQTPLRRKYYGIGSVVDTVGYFDLNTKMEVDVSDGGDLIAPGAISSFVNGTHFIYINTYRYVGGNVIYRPKLGRTSDFENVSLSYPFSFNPDLVYVPEVIVGDSSVLLTLVKDPRKDQSQGDYSNTHIAYSKNGGDTWNIVNDGFFCYSPNINSNIRLENHIKKYGDVWVSIHSLAGTYKVGDSSFSGGGLSVSTDGENWSVKTLPIIAAPGDGENSSIDDRIFPFGSGWVLVIPSTGPQGGYRLEIFYTEDFDTFTQYPNRQWSGLIIRDNITVVNDRVYFSDSMGSNTVSYTDNLTDWYELPLTLNIDNYNNLYIGSRLGIYNFFGKLLTSPVSFKRISPPIDVSAPLYADADGTLKIVGKDFIDISSSSNTNITLGTRVGSTVVFGFGMMNNGEYVGLLETTDGYQSFHKTAIQFGNNADRYNPKLNFGGDRIIVGDRIFNFKPLLVTDSGVYPTKSQTYSVNGSFVRITPTAGVPQVIETTHQIDDTRPFVIDYSTLTYSKIQVEFIGRKVQYPNAGVELSQICDANFSVVKRFTNGNNGSYSELVENNSPECGYNADTLKTLVVSSGQQYMIPIGVKQITFRGYGSKLTPAQFKTSASLIPLASYEVDINRDKTFDFYGVVDYKKINSSMITGNYLSLGPYSYTPYISTNLKDWTQIGNGLLISDNINRAITNEEKVLLFRTGYLDKDLKWNNYRPFLVNTTYANNLFYDDDDRYNRLSVKVKIGADFYWVRAFASYYSRCEITKLDQEWDNFSGEPWIVIRQISGINTVDISLYYWESSKLYFTTTRNNPGTNKTEDIIVSVDFTDPANITVNTEIVAESKYGYPRYFGRFNGKLVLVYDGVIYQRIETNLNSTSEWNILFVFPKYMTVNQPTTVVNTNIMFRITYVGSSTINPGYWWTTDGLLWNHNKFEEVVDSLIAPKVFIPDLINDGFLVSNSNQTVEGYKLYRTYSVNPGDLYKYQDELPGNVTQLAIENHYYEFPGSATEADPVVTEYVLNVDITEPTPVIVNIPPGGYVSAEFYMVDDGSPAAGTELETFCSGYTKNKRYANGVGGSYVLPVEFNSPDCGYVEPVVTATITSFPNTISTREANSIEFYVSLSRSLPNQVSFLIQQTEVGVTAGLITSFEYTFDKVDWTPITVNNQEIQFTSGVTQATFRIVTKAVGLTANANLDIVLINQENPQHISENNTLTNITITADVRVVQPTALVQQYTTTITAPQLWLDNRMFELAYDQQLYTNKSVTGGIYEVELYTDSKSFCVGVGYPEAPTMNGGSNIYPGSEQYTWGFTSGKAWNNGVSTSYGDPWTGKTVALRIDLENLKLGITLDGVYQGDAFTDIVQTVKILISMDPETTGEIVRGIINLGQITPKFPPSGIVKSGFGQLVDPSHLIQESGMAKGILTPSQLVSYNVSPLLGDVKGSFITPSATTITTVDKMTVGRYFWQVVLPVGAIAYLGIAGDGYDPATPLGSDANSFAVKSDFTETIHNGNATPTNIVTTNRQVISLEYSTVTNMLHFRNGAASTSIWIPTVIVNPYVVVQTTQSGLIGINVGNYQQGAFNPSQVAWLGVGTQIGNIPAGMLLAQRCVDVNLVEDYSNGVGGITTSILVENSVDCGYVNTNSLWNQDSIFDNIEFTNPEETGIIFYSGEYMLLGVTNIRTPDTITYFGQLKDEGAYSDPTTAGKGLWLGIAYKDADYTTAPGSTDESIAISIETGEIIHNGVTDTSIVDILTSLRQTQAGTSQASKDFNNLTSDYVALEYNSTTNTLWLISGFLTPNAADIAPGVVFRTEIPFKLTQERDIVAMTGFTDVAGYKENVYIELAPIYTPYYSVSRGGVVIAPPLEGYLDLTYWRSDLIDNSIVTVSDQVLETRLTCFENYSGFGIMSKAQMDQPGVYYFEVEFESGDAKNRVGVVLDSPDLYWSFDSIFDNPNATVLCLGGSNANRVVELGAINTSLNGVNLTNQTLGFEYDSVANTLTIVTSNNTRYTFNTPPGVCAVYRGSDPKYGYVPPSVVNLGQDGFNRTPPIDSIRLLPFVNTTKYWSGDLVNKLYYDIEETVFSKYGTDTVFTVYSNDTITIGNNNVSYGVEFMSDSQSVGFVGFAKTTFDKTLTPGSTGDQVLIDFLNAAAVSNSSSTPLDMGSMTLGGDYRLLLIDGMTGAMKIVDNSGAEVVVPINPFVAGDELCVIAGSMSASSGFNDITVNFGQRFVTESYPVEFSQIVQYNWDQAVWADPKGKERFTFYRYGDGSTTEKFFSGIVGKSARYPGKLVSTITLQSGMKHAFCITPGAISVGIVPASYDPYTDMLEDVINGVDPNTVCFNGDSESGMIYHNQTQYDVFTATYWDNVRDRPMMVYLDLVNNTIEFRGQAGGSTTITIPNNSYKVFVWLKANDECSLAQVNLGTRPMPMIVDSGYTTPKTVVIGDYLYFENTTEMGFIDYYSGEISAKTYIPWMVYTNIPFQDGKHIYWEIANSWSTAMGSIQGMADINQYTPGADPMTAIGACGYNYGQNKWVCDGITTDLPADVQTASTIGLDYDTTQHKLFLIYSDSSGNKTTLEVPIPSFNAESVDFRVMYGYTYDARDLEPPYSSAKRYWLKIGADKVNYYDYMPDGLPAGYSSPVTWIAPTNPVI